MNKKILVWIFVLLCLISFASAVCPENDCDNLMAYDSFTDTNGVIIQNHAMDKKHGDDNWTVIGGTGDIQNNQLHEDTADFQVDTGVADFNGTVIFSLKMMSPIGAFLYIYDGSTRICGIALNNDANDIYYNGGWNNWAHTTQSDETMFLRYNVTSVTCDFAVYRNETQIINSTGNTATAGTADRARIYLINNVYVDNFSMCMNGINEGFWECESTGAPADTSPPSFKNFVNTSANFRKYENFTANITLEDDTALDTYIFSTNASGTWTNSSIVDISGTKYEASSNTNITLDYNQVVGWRYYFNDTSGNANQTDIYTFVVQETPEKFVSIEHFDLTLPDAEFDSPTYILISNTTFSQTEINNYYFKGAVNINKTVSGGSNDVYVRITLNNVVLIDEIINTVTSAGDVKLSSIPHVRNLTIVGDNVLLIEAREVGAGSVSLENFQLHVFSNKSSDNTSIGQEIQRKSFTFSSTTLTNYFNISHTKSITSSSRTYIDIQHTMRSTLSARLICLLNDSSRNLESAYDRSTSGAAAGSTGTVFRDPNITDSIDYNLMCKSSNGATIRNNVSAYFIDLKDDENSTINSGYDSNSSSTFTSDITLTSKLNKIAEINDFVIQDGTALETAAAISFSSLTGSQTPRFYIQVNGTNNTLVVEYYRQVDSNTENATLKFYGSLQTTVGSAYNISLWVELGAGEQISLHDEGILSIEGKEVNLITQQLPPLPNTITNPLNGTSAGGTENFTWLPFVDLNGNFAHYNVSLLNSDSTFNQTIVGNTTNTSTVFITTALSGGTYILEVRGFDTTGLSGAATSTFIIDNLNPALVLITPSTNGTTITVNEGYVFSVNCTDDNLFQMKGTVFQNETEVQARLSQSVSAPSDTLSFTVTFNNTGNGSISWECGDAGTGIYLDPSDFGYDDRNKTTELIFNNYQAGTSFRTTREDTEVYDEYKVTKLNDSYKWEYCPLIAPKGSWNAIDYIEGDFYYLPKSDIPAHFVSTDGRTFIKYLDDKGNPLDVTDVTKIDTTTWKVTTLHTAAEKCHDPLTGSTNTVTENVTFRVIEATAAYDFGFLIPNSCPSESVQSVLMFALIFAILIIFFIVNVLYIKLPILDVVIGIGFIPYGWTILGCSSFLAIIMWCVGLAIATSAFYRNG